VACHRHSVPPTAPSSDDPDDPDEDRHDHEPDHREPEPRKIGHGMTLTLREVAPPRPLPAWLSRACAPTRCPSRLLASAPCWLGKVSYHSRPLGGVAPRGWPGAFVFHPRLTATRSCSPQIRISVTSGRPTFLMRMWASFPAFVVYGRLATSHVPVSSTSRSPIW